MQWEHKVVAASLGLGIDRYLRPLGDEGWELVSVIPDNGEWLTCFFKRPVRRSNRERARELLRWLRESMKVAA